MKRVIRIASIAVTVWQLLSWQGAHAQPIGEVDLAYCTVGSCSTVCQMDNKDGFMYKVGNTCSPTLSPTTARPTTQPPTPPLPTPQPTPQPTTRTCRTTCLGYGGTPPCERSSRDPACPDPSIDCGLYGAVPFCCCIDGSRSETVDSASHGCCKPWCKSEGHECSDVGTRSDGFCVNSGPNKDECKCKDLPNELSWNVGEYGSDCSTVEDEDGNMNNCALDGCYEPGTIQNSCSSHGYCKCQPGFSGVRCDECNSETIEDVCGDFSLPRSCNVGGPCRCLDGVTGETCDQAPFLDANADEFCADVLEDECPCGQLRADGGECSLPRDAMSPTLACLPGFVEYNGVCFGVVHSNLSFPMGKHACKQLNGSLVSFAEYQDELIQLASRSDGLLASSKIWLGFEWTDVLDMRTVDDWRENLILQATKYYTNAKWLAGMAFDPLMSKLKIDTLIVDQQGYFTCPAITLNDRSWTAIDCESPDIGVMCQVPMAPVRCEEGFELSLETGLCVQANQLEPSCGPGWELFEGACFRLFYTKSQYDFAKELCADQDSRLASLSSVQQAVRLAQLLQISNAAWIGLDHIREDTFVDGQIFYGGSGISGSGALYKNGTIIGTSKETQMERICSRPPTECPSGWDFSSEGICLKRTTNLLEGVVQQTSCAARSMLSNHAGDRSVGLDVMDKTLTCMELLMFNTSVSSTVQHQRVARIAENALRNYLSSDKRTSIDKNMSVGELWESSETFIAATSFHVASSIAQFGPSVATYRVLPMTSDIDAFLAVNDRAFSQCVRAPRPCNQARTGFDEYRTVEDPIERLEVYMAYSRCALVPIHQRRLKISLIPIDSFFSRSLYCLSALPSAGSDITDDVVLTGLEEIETKLRTQMRLQPGNSRFSKLTSMASKLRDSLTQSTSIGLIEVPPYSMQIQFDDLIDRAESYQVKAGFMAQSEIKSDLEKKIEIEIQAMTDQIGYDFLVLSHEINDGVTAISKQIANGFNSVHEQFAADAQAELESLTIDLEASRNRLMNLASQTSELIEKTSEWNVTMSKHLSDDMVPSLYRMIDLEENFNQLTEVATKKRQALESMKNRNMIIGTVCLMAAGPMVAMAGSMLMPSVLRDVGRDLASDSTSASLLAENKPFKISFIDDYTCSNLFSQGLSDFSDFVKKSRPYRAFASFYNTKLGPPIIVGAFFMSLNWAIILKREDSESSFLPGEYVHEADKCYEDTELFLCRYENSTRSIFVSCCKQKVFVGEIFYFKCQLDTLLDEAKCAPVNFVLENNPHYHPSMYAWSPRDTKAPLATVACQSVNGEEFSSAYINDELGNNFGVSTCAKNASDPSVIDELEAIYGEIMKVNNIETIPSPSVTSHGVVSSLQDQETCTECKKCKKKRESLAGSQSPRSLNPRLDTSPHVKPGSRPALSSAALKGFGAAAAIGLAIGAASMLGQSDEFTGYIPLPHTPTREAVEESQALLGQVLQSASIAVLVLIQRYIYLVEDLEYDAQIDEHAGDHPALWDSVFHVIMDMLEYDLDLCPRLVDNESEIGRRLHERTLRVHGIEVRTPRRALESKKDLEEQIEEAEEEMDEIRNEYMLERENLHRHCGHFRGAVRQMTLWAKAAHINLLEMVGEAQKLKVLAAQIGVYENRIEQARSSIENTVFDGDKLFARVNHVHPIPSRPDFTRRQFIIELQHSLAESAFQEDIFYLRFAAENELRKVCSAAIYADPRLLSTLEGTCVLGLQSTDNSLSALSLFDLGERLKSFSKKVEKSMLDNRRADGQEEAGLNSLDVTELINLDHFKSTGSAAFHLAGPFGGFGFRGEKPSASKERGGPFFCTDGMKLDNIEMRKVGIVLLNKQGKILGPQVDSSNTFVRVEIELNGPFVKTRLGQQYLFDLPSYKNLVFSYSLPNKDGNCKTEEFQIIEDQKICTSDSPQSQPDSEKFSLPTPYAQWEITITGGLEYLQDVYSVKILADLSGISTIGEENELECRVATNGYRQKEREEEDDDEEGGEGPNTGALKEEEGSWIVPVIVTVGILMSSLITAIYVHRKKHLGHRDSAEGSVLSTNGESKSSNPTRTWSQVSQRTKDQIAALLSKSPEADEAQL